MIDCLLSTEVVGHRLAIRHKLFHDSAFEEMPKNPGMPDTRRTQPKGSWLCLPEAPTKMSLLPRVALHVAPPACAVPLDTFRGCLIGACIKLFSSLPPCASASASFVVSLAGLVGGFTRILAGTGGRLAATRAAHVWAQHADTPRPQAAEVSQSSLHVGSRVAMPSRKWIAKLNSWAAAEIRCPCPRVHIASRCESAKPQVATLWMFNI